MKNRQMILKLQYVEMEPEAVGPVTILAGAFDNVGFIGSNEITITVDTSANLIGVKLYPEISPLRLPVGATMPLTIEGIFDDYITRDITSSINTIYTSSNPSTAEISSNGLITVKAAGETTITVKNLSLQKQIIIIGEPVPDITVSPSSYNFGSVNVGSSSTPHTFIVSNTGSANLTIDKIVLSGLNATEFIVQNDNCSGKAITASDICTIQVVFKPTSPEPKNAVLLIKSNDLDSSTLNIPLITTGIYTLTLIGGWNFISIPIQPENTAIENVLSDISAKVRIVWSFDNQAKQWLKYKPSAVSNQLSAIETGRGYWIYMDEPASLTITGIEPSTIQPLNLYDGWNLVGYSGTDNKDASAGIGIGTGIENKWDVIWNWEDGHWRAKKALDVDTTILAPELTTLNKGKAYWIKMREAAEWQQ